LGARRRRSASCGDRGSCAGRRGAGLSGRAPARPRRARAAAGRPEPWPLGGESAAPRGPRTGLAHDLPGARDLGREASIAGSTARFAESLRARTPTERRRSRRRASAAAPVDFMRRASPVRRETACAQCSEPVGLRMSASSSVVSTRSRPRAQES
jgi:hypothetical protein